MMPTATNSLKMQRAERIEKAWASADLTKWPLSDYFIDFGHSDAWLET